MEKPVVAVSDWAWQAALEINREGDSVNTIPIMETIEKHYLRTERDALQSVQRAAQTIAAARESNGPPDKPPSMLWSALCNIWDHLDILQQEIAAGKYDNNGPFEPAVNPRPEMFKFGGLIDAFDMLPNDLAGDTSMEMLTKEMNALRKWVEDYFDPELTAV